MSQACLAPPQALVHLLPGRLDFCDCERVSHQHYDERDTHRKSQQSRADFHRIQTGAQSLKFEPTQQERKKDRCREQASRQHASDPIASQKARQPITRLREHDPQCKQKE